VQLGDAIDGVTSERGKIRHADVAFAGFINERHAAHSICIAGEFGFHLIEKATVDFKDDFKMAGQEIAE